jgi:signal transduction histidine kinase
MESLSYFMDTEIWIINPSGRMVVNSASAPDPEQEIMVEGFDPTVTQKNFYTIGTFFDSFEEDKLSVIAPIINNYKTRGYVIIHKSATQIDEDANSMLNISYLMLIVILFLSLIILIFFTEVVYRPLRRIIAATEQYASGNMHYELNVEGEDEMGYLAASLGYMARTVASFEDDQKKFIANVSHDFRSPLTSIRGFLEAMLDGTIPPEMHEHYLGVVLNETERLTKLTNSLLTLNNLNTKGMLLQMTDWNINDVIRKVSASFEQVCRSKNIKIRLILSGEVLYVHADLDKIQQVLYNLIDNAIKFSDYYSEIEIETSEKKEKVFVSVKDNGIGIPKEDQNQIWERFYKTDLSRGKDKKGTGLGLSIVREIIRAHGENISLVSTQGVGSKFTFTLKRSELNDELDEEDPE